MHKISDCKMPEQLSLDAGWSIGETAFERILEFENRNKAFTKMGQAHSNHLSTQLTPSI